MTGSLEFISASAIGGIFGYNLYQHVWNHNATTAVLVSVVLTAVLYRWLKVRMRQF